MGHECMFEGCIIRASRHLKLGKVRSIQNHVMGHTVNIEIFGQYIFSHISRRSLNARKDDASESIHHDRLHGTNY